jgi:uncharacterized membrane protein
MFWFLVLVIFLFIGLIFGIIEYLQKLFEDLYDPSTRPTGIFKLLSVTITALMIYFIIF